ncbi:Enoyl-CoA hydratase [Burkholderia sp. OK233]|nr:Enoyl-CoA hydratase [Burkholderia sp. OK233]
MPTNYSSLHLEIDDGLAIVTMAQPSRGNPIDAEFTREFKDVFLELWDTAGLRAVLLRAEGENFSFGGDLKTFHPARHQLPALVRRLTSDLHMGLSRAWQLPVPIVAEVQGWAMGGALGMLAGCDVVVAAESARFGSAFSRLGFSCDTGSSVTLTFRMGAARARRFVLLGEVLSSAEALAAGLVDRVVLDAQLGDMARGLASELAAGPTLAYGEIKRLFRQAGHAQLEARLEDEALTLARISGTQDAQEGVAAMFERRKPSFQGR